MKALGFNIVKGVIWHCVLEGTKDTPVYLSHGRDLFDSDSPRTELANHFKQTFVETISRVEPGRLAYRLSLDGKSAKQIGYLYFSFGILNLIAHDSSLAIKEFSSQAFTKRALCHAGDKFAACDERIVNSPASWKNPEKLAALAAWMALDV